MDGGCACSKPRPSPASRRLRPARSSPRGEPASTSRRATVCFVFAEFSRRRAVRWTPKRISRRTRCREWRLSPEAPAGAEVRAVAARLVAKVLDERVTADELLPAAGVSGRDQPLLAALVLGALRWHYRLEWQARRLLARPLAARANGARRAAARGSAAIAGVAHTCARRSVRDRRRRGAARRA